MSWFSKKRCKKIKNLQDIINELDYEVYALKEDNKNLINDLKKASNNHKHALERADKVYMTNTKNIQEKYITSIKRTNLIFKYYIAFNLLLIILYTVH